ncbi:MAG: energy transducer TonB [Steroidobacteraceae bacterium]
MAGNLGEATRLTDAARAVDPDHVRVKFLSTQIAREQARITARRQAVAELAVRSAPKPVAPPAASPSVAPPPAPVASASAPTTTAATVSSSPAMGQERKSVPAIVLQRVHSVEPEFPELARTRAITGYVDVEFTVLSDGTVANVAVVKSQPSGVFEKSAMVAVRQWRYRPLIRDGVPIEEHARVRLNFDYK